MSEDLKTVETADQIQARNILLNGSRADLIDANHAFTEKKHISEEKWRMQQPFFDVLAGSVLQDPERSRRLKASLAIVDGLGDPAHVIYTPALSVPTTVFKGCAPLDYADSTMWIMARADTGIDGYELVAAKGQTLLCIHDQLVAERCTNKQLAQELFHADSEL